MTLRNRELANLIVVGLLTAIGFASVYIARQAVVSTGSAREDTIIRDDSIAATWFGVSRTA